MRGSSVVHLTTALLFATPKGSARPKTGMGFKMVTKRMDYDENRVSSFHSPRFQGSSFDQIFFNLAELWQTRVRVRRRRLRRREPSVASQNRRPSRIFRLQLFPDADPAVLRPQLHTLGACLARRPGAQRHGRRARAPRRPPRRRPLAQVPVRRRRRLQGRQELDGAEFEVDWVSWRWRSVG